MIEVCKKCEHWIELVHFLDSDNVWVDDDSDDQCYDEDMNLQGTHEPGGYLY